MLLVQQFLLNNSLANLEIQHGVYASVSKNKRKISLNYDMIEAKDSDFLSQDCRGIILSKIDDSEFETLPGSKLNKEAIVGNTKVVAFGFKRFFNYGQGASANIDWNDPNLSILEKLDGTLCQLYYDNFQKQWHVATRSVPEADLLMDNNIYTFRTLFEKALLETAGLSFEEYTSNLNKDITYCFELTSPYNRIVVNYKDCRITLLAARAIIYEINSAGESWFSFEELDINNIETYGVPRVRAYAYNSLNEVLNWVSSLSPLEHEGVVVKDSKFNRIKIKNAAYVASSKFKDACTSLRNRLEIILLEKDDDVMSFVPEEIAKELVSLKNKVKKLIHDYDSLYLKIKEEADIINKGDKKTFALLCSKHKNIWTAPFFNIFDNKASNFRDFINKNKSLQGSWSNSFLDKILEIIDI